MTESKPDRSEPSEEPESLKDATRTALLEGRVILTSVATLFGFQLNVVFSTRFKEDLVQTERVSHLVALVLNAIAIAIVMLPSAYGRQAEPRQVSRRFIRLLSRTHTIALAPMLVSIAIDMSIIAALVLGRGPYAIGLAVGLAVLFTILWFVYPRVRAYQLEKQGKGPANDPSKEGPRRAGAHA